MLYKLLILYSIGFSVYTQLNPIHATTDVMIQEPK